MNDIDGSAPDAALVVTDRATLHLIPVPISTEDGLSVLPPRTCEAAFRLQHFLVENARSARRALKSMGHPRPLQSLTLIELPAELRSTDPGDAAQSAQRQGLMDTLLAPLLAGISIGVLSESGCPGIADPGAWLAGWAHAHAVPVQAHVGPSSILLALMASGLQGQRFAFHGYLPVGLEERKASLIGLERRSALEQSTQLFIETPYRNQALSDTMLAGLQGDTRVLVASDLTGSQQLLRTRTVIEWRKAPPALPRLPTVFGLLAGLQALRKAQSAVDQSAVDQPAAANDRHGTPRSRRNLENAKHERKLAARLKTGK